MPRREKLIPRYHTYSMMLLRSGFGIFLAEVSRSFEELEDMSSDDVGGSVGVTTGTSRKD